jgi:CRISPR system Cascade subunit CasC
MTKNIYLDINIIQTVPSSNINRDDTGAPKTAQYGGVTRARVSSQSWKRVMREMFSNDYAGAKGSRTKDAARLLAENISKLDGSLSNDDVTEKVSEILKAAGIKLNKENQTSALLLISHGQLEQLAKYALSHDKFDKKELKSVLTGNQSLDLALFGRMVADNPELNVEGSAQVAHAVSTHEVIPEFDYYTALDDERSEDSVGAAMLGTGEYNSATFYRYANLNLHELMHNLGGNIAIEGALSYLKSFLLSMPTGKQNSHANKTIPNYVLVTLRTDTPVNLVSAFEKPIKSREGYVEASIQKLEEEYQSTLQFVERPQLTLSLSKYDGNRVADIKAATNLTDLLAQVSDGLKKVVPDENLSD